MRAAGAATSQGLALKCTWSGWCCTPSGTAAGRSGRYSTGRPAWQIQVLGIDTEMLRIACTAEGVPAEELRRRADLVAQPGWRRHDAARHAPADRQRSPVLGVNLGKLGFLAEVDVPDLADALSAIDSHEFTTEPRLAVDALVGDQLITAFNDIAFVRFPGQKTAAIAVEAGGRPFVSYAADAIVVATPTGSTADSLPRVVHREPGGGGAPGHARGPAFGLQPRPGRLGG